MTEMDEGGQKPVDEHQPVLRAGAYDPLPSLGGEPGLVPIVPQQADFGHEFSDHISRQAPDPPVAVTTARVAFPTTQP
ncbi:hypothetical protein [Streptomyces sp. NPDC055709]